MRAVLFVWAELAALPVEIKKDDFIICADVGLKTAERFGVRPSVVIGDFDSYPNGRLYNGEKVVLKDFLLEKHEVTLKNGSTGLRYGMNFTLSTPNFWEKLGMAWNQSLDTVRMVRLSLQMLLGGKVGIKDMSGPVGIVSEMSKVAAASDSKVTALLNMLYFGGFIAINLAVMNLLPIPALDGGRIVCLLITVVVEAITKKKINPKYEGYLHGAGMILLLALMAIIMFKDVIFLFKR